jgi:Ca-activated chloride channel family protein
MFPQFANPAFLLLTLAAPVLLWWQLRKQRGAVRHSLAASLGSLPRAAIESRWGGPLLRCLALVGISIALAGPRQPDPTSRVQTEGIAIIMVVDVSGSMDEPDFDWRGQQITRLEAVKRVFRLFVQGGAGNEAADETDASGIAGRPADLIGMVVFATHADDLCPLTLHHSALLGLLDKEKPRTIPGESSTNISDAIALGLERVNAAGPRRKVLVLLTDGEHNVDKTRSGWTPLQAAHVAEGLEIPIYVIDAGGKPTNREPGAAIAIAQNRAQAEQTLQGIAKISEGRYFAARNTADLIDACRKIDEKEKAPIESFQYRRYKEAYPWFAMGAAICWLLAMTLEWTWWRRSP